MLRATLMMHNTLSPSTLLIRETLPKSGLTLKIHSICQNAPSTIILLENMNSFWLKLDMGVVKVRLRKRLWREKN